MNDPIEELQAVSVSLKRLLERSLFGTERYVDLADAERIVCGVIEKLSDAADTIHILHREKQEDAERVEAKIIELINERDAKPAVQPPVTTVEQCSECGTVLSLIGWQGAGTEEYDCRVCRLRSENSKLADRLAEAEARIVEVEGYGREYIERTDPLIACATAAGESDEPCCGKCNVCLKQRLEQAQTDQQDYNESNQLLGRGDHDAHSLSYRVAKLLRRLEQAEAKFTGGSWGGACDVIAARISEEKNDG